MYLHIGNSKNIREKEIVGIFDTDNATLSASTRKFLSEAERQGKVSAASAEIPKSFVIYREEGQYKIYFSQSSSASLLGRSGETVK